MMFKLPFYLPSVTQGAVAGLVVGSLLIGFTVLADRGVWPFRQVVEVFITLRMRPVPEEKRFRLFKAIMLTIGTLFLATGLFYGLVLSGVMQNGDLP